METQKAGGGSLVGFAIILLILFLLFPVFTWYLMWVAILFMLFAGIAALFMPAPEWLLPMGLNYFNYLFFLEYLIVIVKWNN